MLGTRAVGILPPSKLRSNCKFVVCEKKKKTSMLKCGVRRAPTSPTGPQLHVGKGAGAGSQAEQSREAWALLWYLPAVPRVWQAQLANPCLYANPGAFRVLKKW